MTHPDVRSLEPRDFDAIMQLEHDLFGAKGQTTLGPFFVRLCCDFCGDTSFIARVDGRSVGYILLERPAIAAVEVA